MSKTLRARLVSPLVLLLTLAVWMLAQGTAEVRYPIGNDAIGYIGQANNFLAGRGLVSTPNETELPDLDYAPSRYHPPGFGLAIAAVAAFGIPVESAARFVSYVSWALLPSALLFALSAILPLTWAFSVTVLCVLSPGMYLFGSTVNADVPTLLLLVLAIGLIIRSVGSQINTKYLIAAGALLGFAYVIRNSVTAVFAGLLAAFVAAVALRQMSASAAARQFLLIVLGSAPFIGLLLLRNEMTFGEAQPYVLMVGTSATLLESFRVFLDGLGWDLTGSRWLGKELAWTLKVLIIAGLPVVALIAWGLARQWKQAALHTRFAILFGLMFSAASAGMLVIAHTYHGLDFRFLLRHMMQFGWILLALMVLGALAYHGRLAKGALALILALLLVSRLWFIADDLRVERDMQRHFVATPNIEDAAQPYLSDSRVLTSQIRPALARDGAVASAVNGLPSDALILSNHGPLLSHVTGRPVRVITSPTTEELPSIGRRIEQIFREMHRDRPVFLVLVPDNRLLHSIDHADWKGVIVKQLPLNLREVSRGDNFLVLRAYRQPPLADSTQ